MVNTVMMIWILLATISFFILPQIKSKLMNTIPRPTFSMYIFQTSQGNLGRILAALAYEGWRGATVLRLPPFGIFC